MEDYGRFLYHVTALENWKKIKTEGLVPNEDGHVFALITDARKVVREIAVHQIFKKKVAVIRIDIEGMKRAGFRFTLLADKVAEFTARLHRIIFIRSRIPNSFLNLHSSMSFYAHSPKFWVKILKRRGVEISPEIEREFEKKGDRSWQRNEKFGG